MYLSNYKNIKWKIIIIHKIYIDNSRFILDIYKKYGLIIQNTSFIIYISSNFYIINQNISLNKIIIKIKVRFYLTKFMYKNYIKFLKAISLISIALISK